MACRRFPANPKYEVIMSDKLILTPILQSNGKWAIEDPDTGEIIAQDFTTLQEAQEFINNYKG